MKTIDIIGDNYCGQWKKSRTACRAVVIRDGDLLLSYETKTDTWMLPGGGVEPGESDAACCVREVCEETGSVVLPGECFLEIDEYYEDRKWVNRYFVCTVAGEGERHLTEPEIAAGMEPRWIPVTQAVTIFGTHADYAATDEERRGMHQREYIALCEWCEIEKTNP